MKETFLVSLVGMKVIEAEDLVKGEGYETFTVPSNMEAITQIARPKTVILWQKDGKVRSAEPGDFLELE